MARPVLDTRTLNRALLARQLLLERSRLPLVRAVERVGGLQTQYAPSAYIGLWSRLEGFSRPQLTRALEQRRVIQATLMRVTIHLVSAQDYPILTEAVRVPRRDWWNRVAREQRLDEDGWAKATDLVRDALSAGPASRTELIEVLTGAGYPKDLWNGVGLWLDMVRVPPSGTWERRRADLYGLAEDWVAMGEVGEQEGLEHLVRRYLGGFGPAKIGDIASWAGVPITTVRPVAERMNLRIFSDQDGDELVDLPRRPLPSPEVPAPVRFLPTWDATLLAHARRTQILPEEYRGIVFRTNNPQSVPTFLIDGAVAGSWKPDGDRVKLDPFAPVPRRFRRELEEEAGRLAIFLT